MKLIAGTVVAERFRLIRQLGAGGMGAVWLAQHMGLGIPCAVKFILGDPSPELRGRFEREARAAAQIRSPNVVQVLDSGIYEGTPYMAMEYLEGEDLGHRLKRQGRIAPAETAMIMGQVARALGRAHAAGLVHRDLKPENIFLVRDEDREIAKVLDFGIAKDNSAGALDGSTRTGALLGTPYYMSPEQARGVKAVDHRADLWSLAVVVYQCVTGQLPFISDALGDLLVQIIMNPIPVPSQVVQGLPLGFDAWWARAAQRDPTQRFQSAKELADSLAMACGVSAGFETQAPFGSSAGGMQPLPSLPGVAASGHGAPFPSHAAHGGQMQQHPQQQAPMGMSQPGYPQGGPSPQQGYTPVGMPMGSQPGMQMVPQQPFNPTPSGAQPPPMLTTGGVVAAAQVMGEPPKAKGGAAIAIVIGAVALLGLAGGAFFVLHGRAGAPPAPSAVAATAPPSATPPASAAADPSPPASAEPVASAEPAASASAAPAVASAAPTSAARVPGPIPVPHPPKPAGTPPPKPKGRDFGF